MPPQMLPPKQQHIRMCVRIAPRPIWVGSMKEDSLNKTPRKIKLSESTGKLSGSAGKLSESANSIKNRARTGSGNEAKTFVIRTKCKGKARSAAPWGGVEGAALVVFHLVRTSMFLPHFRSPFWLDFSTKFADSENSLRQVLGHRA